MSAALALRCSGIGYYIANMVAGLRDLEPRTELELLYYSNRAVLDGSGARIMNMTEGEVYSQDQLPFRTPWMQLKLPGSIKRTQPDICHFPNYLAPVMQDIDVPFLTTMYDMSIYRHPECHPVKTNLVHRAIMPQVARQANLVITASESARQEILHYLPVTPEKVRVVYGSISQQFLTVPTTEQQAAVKHHYGLDFPYILMVGTLEPRKNHARFIEAFSQLIEQEHLPHHLVLVGAHGWKEKELDLRAKAGKAAERIHFLGYVPDEDLNSLYRGAAAFVFPSIHEGFGLPMLEAMACGTPTLISSDEALMEVAGPYTALVADPYSVEDMARQTFRLLTDTGLRTELQLMGPLHARQFSRQSCAAKTLELYREVWQQSQRQIFSQPAVHINASADSGEIPARTINASADSGEAPVKPEQGIVIISPSKALAPFLVRSLEKLDIDNIGDEREMSESLEQAIMKTVIYADIFSYPLRTDEIHRYLIGEAADLATVETCLRYSSYLARYLEKYGNYVYLEGRSEAVVVRQGNGPQREHQWQIIRFWGKWLRAVPFLQAALVTGGLAAGSVRAKDDIDLFLITAPEHLWTCRALVVGLVYLARLRGVELCPNYLLTDSKETLTLPDHSLYTAREFVNMRLVFGQETYQKLQQYNTWAHDFLPNAALYARSHETLLPDEPGWLGKTIKRVGEKLLSTRLGRRLEQWEQKRKIARLTRPDAPEACFTADTCKGHYKSYGQETLTTFAQRCVDLDLQPETKLSIENLA